MRLIDADTLIKDLSQSDIDVSLDVINMISKQRSYSELPYRAVVKSVGDRLTYYFTHDKSDKLIYKALNDLAYDPYIDVIYCQYRDCITLEAVASYMGKDITTIKRNKKRLILKIYEYMR